MRPLTMPREKRNDKTYSNPLASASSIRTGADRLPKQHPSPPCFVKLTASCWHWNIFGLVVLIFLSCRPPFSLKPPDSHRSVHPQAALLSFRRRLSTPVVALAWASLWRGLPFVAKISLSSSVCPVSSSGSVSTVTPILFRRVGLVVAVLGLLAGLFVAIGRGVDLHRGILRGCVQHEHEQQRDWCA